ncbi:MAG: rhomboid family intramembrane serine protease [Acidimicrobiia bacterium]
MASIIPRASDRKRPLLPIRDINPTAIRPLITWGLIVLCTAIFFLVQPQDVDDSNRFVYRHAAIACEITTGAPLDVDEIRTGICRDDPSSATVFPDKSIWQSVLNSIFLHGSIVHLLFNMWSLWIFGNNVEEAFGHVGYLMFFVATGIAATIGFVALNPSLTIPLVGASGSIAGVMGAYVVLFPTHRVLTLIFFRVVAIRAIWFLGIWFLSQFLMAGEESSIAWEAHVAGFLAGAIIALPFREALLARTLEGAGRRYD